MTTTPRTSIPVPRDIKPRVNPPHQPILRAFLGEEATWEHTLIGFKPLQIAPGCVDAAVICGAAAVCAQPLGVVLLEDVHAVVPTAAVAVFVLTRSIAPGAEVFTTWSAVVHFAEAKL